MKVFLNAGHAQMGIQTPARADMGCGNVMWRRTSLIFLRATLPPQV